MAADQTPTGTFDEPGDTPADRNVGRLLAGKYELRELIAEGGMGTVYRAVQRGLGRQVAVKLVHEHLAPDDEVLKRFYREMQATARIEHPHTVRIYDFGHTDEGDVFLVMEFLEGRTLAEELDEAAPFPAARTARIGARIARALAAAHAEGVVHRDLKPENILLVADYGPDDWVKVLDFGLARLEDAHPADRTEVGVRVGTPLYMAPEYVRLEGADHRADLYALGVLLFQMITGEPPFSGEPRQVLHAQEHQAPPRATDLAPEHCPAWLDRLIGKLLAKDPDRRPADAARVARFLEKGEVREAAVEAGHVGPGLATGRSSRRLHWAIAAGAGALGVGTFGVVLLVLCALGLWFALG